MEARDHISELERIVIGAVALTTRALAEAAPGTELTFPQWRALLVLGEDPAGARVGQVAFRVGVTVPATSRLLRRLERRGLVALAIDEADRRATRARLTSLGDEVRTSILGYRRSALRELSERLTGPDTEATSSAIEQLADAFGSFA
jgi:DNA-binding MarR family transcriptional regulator